MEHIRNRDIKLKDWENIGETMNLNLKYFTRNKNMATVSKLLQFIIIVFIIKMDLKIHLCDHNIT